MNVCIVNNLYCLLLYMLIKKVDAFKNTLYFFDDDIPQSIIEQFSGSIHFITPQSNIAKFFFILKLRFYKYRYGDLRYAEIYGQDNLLITSPLIGGRKMAILEDGMMNYTYKPVKIPYSRVRRILGGPLWGQNPLGYSDSVSKIFLTGLSTIPDGIKNKVEIVNLKDLWDGCSVEIRKQILTVFGVNKSILDRFRPVKCILLTQPLSEDGVISEKEKIELYKQLINNEIVAIKPHPREKTNYKSFFPNIEILPSSLPFELLSLNDITFEKVKTLFSTAALSVPGNPEIHFMGTDVCPALVAKWGKITYREGRLVREDNLNR